MTHQPTIPATDLPFAFSCEAAQDTVWVSDPAEPANARTGSIHKGETIWLQAHLFGSGPVWQSARLANDTICFVQPHHFATTNP